MAVQQSGVGCSLPLYFRFPTDERVIAVTVDDCYEVDNLRRIVGAARSCGAKLTLFPIGENLSKPGMADLIRRCVFEYDFEIENHTWSHARIFRLPENEMAREIWDQGQALNRLLGVNYEQHFSGFSEFVFLAIMAAVMAQGRLEPATALVLYNYNSQMSTSGVRSVSEITNTVFNLGLSAERIWQLMCSVDYEQEVFGERTLPKVRGDLEIRDVGFTYDNVDNRVTVLKHLSLSIRAGESVAFVGKSGCGKSTILSLITRLYDPEEGEILLDGVPVRELTQDSLRGNISMVSQTPYIFNMSIRDNLRLVDAGLTDEEMMRACRIACIHDDIMNFPMGYDTQAGEGGVTLSGGQRQRIALARSILRNDPVILMDEATSALDNETQARIHQAVENMRGHHTLIMVAHRLSTVIGCDRLFLIENGRVAATGTHEQLMNASEAYRRLYQTEARAVETEQSGEMGPA